MEKLWLRNGKRPWRLHNGETIQARSPSVLPEQGLRLTVPSASDLAAGWGSLEPSEILEKWLLHDFGLSSLQNREPNKPQLFK